MGSSCYVIDYAGSYTFAAPPRAVWSAMEEVDQFEHWLGWLGNLRVVGPPLRTGSTLHGTVAPPVPYRMRVLVQVERCIPEQLVDASVGGDLEGRAHLSLEPAPEGTLVEVAWTIEMMQTAMRVAARFAYPLLRWGHDRVVDATVKAFESRLHQSGDAGGRLSGQPGGTPPRLSHNRRLSP